MANANRRFNVIESLSIIGMMSRRFNVIESLSIIGTMSSNQAVIHKHVVNFFESMFIERLS